MYYYLLNALGNTKQASIRFHKGLAPCLAAGRAVVAEQKILSGWIIFGDRKGLRPPAPVIFYLRLSIPRWVTLLQLVLEPGFVRECYRRRHQTGNFEPAERIMGRTNAVAGTEVAIRRIRAGFYVHLVESTVGRHRPSARGCQVPSYPVACWNRQMFS
eukprot:1319972-Amorphochlora_amoeboformis.AAC.2